MPRSVWREVCPKSFEKVLPCGRKLEVWWNYIQKEWRGTSHTGKPIAHGPNLATVKAQVESEVAA